MAKVLVSIPDDLLERVDREADRRRITRSALLQQAARRELGWSDISAIDAALQRGREAMVGAGTFESVDEIRRERDEHDVLHRRR